MDTKTQRIIGTAIMVIAIVIEIYSLMFAQNALWDLGILIFLIGIIINDLGTYRKLRTYEDKYGEI